MTKFIAVFFIFHLLVNSVLSDTAYELNKKGVEYSNRREYKKAIDQLKKALEKKDDKTIKKNLIIAYNNFAIEMYEEKKYEDAIDIIEEALYIDDNNENLNNLMGNIYFAMSKYDLSKKYFEKAVDISNDIRSHIGLAGVYYKLNFIDDAIYQYEYILEKEPSNIESLFNLARIHYDRDELDKAREYLLKINSEFPTSIHIDSVNKMLSKINKEKKGFSNYSERFSNHFIIKYQGEEKKEAAKKLIEILDEIYNDVGQKLGFYPDENVIVILYTGKQFKNITGGPDWAGALYDGKIRVPIGNIENSINNLKQILIHEYTHMCIYYIADGKCPTWLNEGIAQYIANQYIDIGFLKRLINSKKFISPFEFPQSFLKLDNFTAKVVYQISYVFVKYICEEESIYTFLRIMEDIKKNNSAEDAIQNWTYLDKNELFERVVEYINKKL